MPSIHPTAIVDSGAKIADDAKIGAFCVVEADTEIGPGCELMHHAVVRRYTTMGEGNVVDSFCVLGGLPQDLKFDPATPTYVRIGKGNRFREGVTISRATKAGGATVVGDFGYWMTASHAGHDTTVGDNVILANGSAVGGHTTIGDRVILSGGAMIHQFCWVGQMVMTQGQAGVTCHVPPFTLVANINGMIGLNSVGLRRNPQITEEDRRQVKQAFHLTYDAGQTGAKAIAEMDTWADISPAALLYREFLRKVLTAQPPFKRGLCPLRRGRRRAGGVT
jgi:UDP-N-acetylglucosamine acyltransferase